MKVTLKPPRFKQKQYDNLIYDYQAFSVKEGSILLEKNLKISLPKLLYDKTIKQVEIIPKPHSFQAVFQNCVLKIVNVLVGY
ncbi:MAG TPA: hypothetical protein ENI48_02575 [Thioploca sp.]|nr:hypothetical protein [Thioploca sp.]